MKFCKDCAYLAGRYCVRPIDIADLVYGKDYVDIKFNPYYQRGTFEYKVDIPGDGEICGLGAKFFVEKEEEYSVKIAHMSLEDII